MTISRLVMAKMTLIVFLPVLFSSPGEHVSEDIRNKLLISGIEVAEYNHALNAEERCRQWRWVYQTHTHWHSIVFLLIEISRRSWSPIVERAWQALHSPWLIPRQSPKEKDLRIWIPLRKLMLQAGKHREDELSWLRMNPELVDSLEREDEKIPLPSSHSTFSAGETVENLRQRWRELVSMPAGTEHSRQPSQVSSKQPALNPSSTLTAPPRSAPEFNTEHVSSLSANNSRPIADVQEWEQDFRNPHYDDIQPMMSTMTNPTYSTSQEPGEFNLQPVSSFLDGVAERWGCCWL